jgi:hypothetical protein
VLTPISQREVYAEKKPTMSEEELQRKRDTTNAWRKVRFVLFVRVF